MNVIRARRLWHFPWRMRTGRLTRLGGVGVGVGVGVDIRKISRPVFRWSHLFSLAGGASS
jgi:hypothetical protein